MHSRRKSIDSTKPTNADPLPYLPLDDADDLHPPQSRPLQRQLRRLRPSYQPLLLATQQLIDVLADPPTPSPLLPLRSSTRVKLQELATIFNSEAKTAADADATPTQPAAAPRVPNETDKPSPPPPRAPNEPPAAAPRVPTAETNPRTFEEATPSLAARRRSALIAKDNRNAPTDAIHRSLCQAQKNLAAAVADAPFLLPTKPKPALAHIIRREEQAAAAAAELINFASTVIDPVTGAAYELRNLLKGPDRDVWNATNIKEWDRLAQGEASAHADAINTVFFIHRHEVPSHKKATYIRPVAMIRPQKDDPHRVRLR
mmetsp:Transcript_18581/g.40437  ORF Transcript_18581/g.40437 Transcript_18581/m.40437 type:complete len:316 (-) Transcript_18581:32-979(-)